MVRLKSWDIEKLVLAGCSMASRNQEGIELLESDDTIWIRGAVLDDELQKGLRSIPGLLRYELLEGDRLSGADHFLREEGAGLQRVTIVGEDCDRQFH